MDDTGQRELLLSLVQQHYALVYRFAYRLTGSVADAEDLTQHTFLSAQSHLDQLRDMSRARGWLCSIARNRFLKQVTRNPSIPVPCLDHLPDPATDAPTSDDLAIDEEHLQNALNELPDEFRVPLVLFYFEELSYREIAEQLNVPVGTVMSRLARAKRHLHRKLRCGPDAAIRNGADLPNGRVQVDSVRP